jgi:hypothetical protein
MGDGGIAPASSPSPAARRRDNTRASSAGAAVSVALIMLYVIWRFVWQSRKHASRDNNVGDVSSAPPPSAASVDVERGDNKTELLPVFVHVAAPPGAAGAEEKAECAVCLVEFGHGEPARPGGWCRGAATGSTPRASRRGSG